MPPKKRNLRGTRATSAASTPSNILDSDSAMPDVDEDNTTKASPSLKSPVNSSMTPSLTSGRNRRTHKEPINDEWTDEQDTSLFKGLVHWKPVGMHRHFRMIALSKYLRNHGYDPEVDTHTRPDGIRTHLEKYFDLETLGQREDHIDDDSNDPQYIEFSLPDEYEDMMWEQGRKKKKASRNKGGDKTTQDNTENEEEEWDSSPPRFDPSTTPSIPKKRKRGDTITRTRGSTVEETDDARSSVQSVTASEVPTASTNRAVRSNKRATMVASSSRQASKDITADEEGDDDNGDENEDETDDTASIKATTRSNAKSGKGGTQAKSQTTARKSGRKR